MADYAAKIAAAADYIAFRAQVKPTVGLVLGSGLGDLADKIDVDAVIPYRDIPHFPVSTVAGHRGELVIGRLQRCPVVAMRGRLHYYEGWSMADVVVPVYVMRRLGVRVLILTNAAGGLNPDFSPGQLMLIRDHLNLTGANPLIGPNDADLGPRFPDMSQAYDRGLSEGLAQVARRLSIPLQEGVYAGIDGPNYFSKAELRALLFMGADALGMSTVAETIAANHCGLKVAAVSCITDMANPDLFEPPTHELVLEMAERVKPMFMELLTAFVGELGEE